MPTDIGIDLEELGDDRQHTQAPEHNWRRDDEVSAGRRIIP
jgi:hypothetical protein